MRSISSSAQIGRARCVAEQAIEPPLAELLAAVATGSDSVAALAAGCGGADHARVGLMKLELMGLVRRVPGDRYVAVLR